jgi:hypothetical protein
MPTLSPAHTIVARAQEAVDRWSSSSNQPNFALAMETACWLHWTLDDEHALEREAFQQVAHAICRGEGNVLTRPMPLLHIAQVILDR